MEPLRIVGPEGHDASWVACYVLLKAIRDLGAPRRDVSIGYSSRRGSQGTFESVSLPNVFYRLFTDTQFERAITEADINMATGETDTDDIREVDGTPSGPDRRIPYL